MKSLTHAETAQVSGGNPIAVIGTILVIAEIMDIAYNAGKAFGEGYVEKDDI